MESLNFLVNPQSGSEENLMKRLGLIFVDIGSLIVVVVDILLYIIMDCVVCVNKMCSNIDVQMWAITVSHFEISTGEKLRVQVSAQCYRISLFVFSLELPTFDGAF